jgi:hypothetical protein
MKINTSLYYPQLTKFDTDVWNNGFECFFYKVFIIQKDERLWTVNCLAVAQIIEEMKLATMEAEFQEQPCPTPSGLSRRILQPLG